MFGYVQKMKQQDWSFVAVVAFCASLILSVVGLVIAHSFGNESLVAGLIVVWGVSIVGLVISFLIHVYEN